MILTKKHKLTESTIDEPPSSPLSISDLLRERLAFITGCTQNQCPILTFPDTPHAELTEEKYRKLVSYLTQVPSETERRCGFVLIIDRRADRWMSVKSIMGYIEDYFPYSIQCIYLLRPNTWMQRTWTRWTVFGEISCSFRLIICRTLMELHEYFSADQLSKDLGGLIDCRLEQWIEEQLCTEKLIQSMELFRQRFLRFTRECDENDFPNGVQSARDTLIDQSREYHQLDEELQHLKTGTHVLLCKIRQQQQIQSAPSTVDKLDSPAKQSIHINTCLDALALIEQTERRLAEVWSLHRARLNHCLALRHFEEDFKEVHGDYLRWYDELMHLSDLNTSALVSPANPQALDQRFLQLDDLSQRAQMIISHINLLANDGLALLKRSNEEQPVISCGVDSIEPKRQELEEMKRKLIEQIERKTHFFNLLKMYIEQLTLINNWCTRGQGLLAMHFIHFSDEQAIRSLKELEQFLADFSALAFEELQLTTSEPFRSMIIEVFHRVDDVRDSCLQRCEQLRQLIRPMYRPTQRARAILIKQYSTTSAPLFHQQQSHESASLSDKDSNRSSSSSTLSNANSMAEQNANIDRKQRQVFTEFLATEQVYVNELRTIIEGYVLQMDDPEQQRSLPAAILQNKSILFSNLPEIYAFHARSFLRDLQQISDAARLIDTYAIGSAVASCFIKRKYNFELYEHYVLNKSQSEHIWTQYCSSHPFFAKIQQTLGHRLTLDSYLLKPIQRIAQYQLLLKEMIKYTRDEQERAHLEEALEVMLAILAYLNDLMHSTQIVGYPGNLNGLGPVRIRAEHCLASKEKRRGTVYSRTKTSRRDVFLFERQLLLCKRKDEVNGKCLQYQWKETIQISDVALCAYAKNDQSKLEILLKDWSYIIQLGTDAIHESLTMRWMEMIRTLMSQQVEQRRAEMKHRSASLDNASQSRRRRKQNQATVSYRAPESDDDHRHKPIALFDLNHPGTVRMKTKLSTSNSVIHL